MLTSCVVRGRSALSLGRSLAVGLLVTACAKLADLGAGNEVASALPDAAKPPDVGITDVNIAITPETLDYGDVPCGTEPASQLITIQNKGSSPAELKVQLPAGTAFRLKDALGDGTITGTLAPKGDSKTIEVLVNPQNAGENTANILVKAGEALQQVKVTAKGSGPTFELVQTTIAFGDVRKENGADPIDVAVKNTGTEPASVAAFTSSNPAFAVKWATQPAAFTVAPGGTSSFKVTLTSATVDDSAALTSTIKPNTTKFCGPSPLLTVSGRRVTSDVTLSPADWDKQDCNSSPPPKDILITNYANAVVTYSLKPAAGSAFTILDEGPHSIAAAQSPASPQTATIRVAPKTLGNTAPLKNIIEMLGVVLNSTAPGVSGSKDVPLHVDTRGAIVTITPTAIALSSDGSTADTKSFQVTNTGNGSIAMSWNLAQVSGAGMWAQSSPALVGGGGNASGTVSFKSTQPGSASVSLTATRIAVFSAALCQPIPVVTLTGTKP